jgi:uncharacterized damage-inducible protein DinB
MSLIENLIQEFERESATTRRVLERVPADKLTWKPHPKSMSIGELALHIAEEPAALAPTALTGGIDFGKHVSVRQPATASEILGNHDAGVMIVTNVLRQLGDAGLQRTWNATINGAPYFSVPLAAFVRNVLLNHIYHHRGQLSVYLRLLDVPVPAIYGPSADEAPFAAHQAAATA